MTLSEMDLPAFVRSLEPVGLAKLKRLTYTQRSWRGTHDQPMCQCMTSFHDMMRHIAQLEVVDIHCERPQRMILPLSVHQKSLRIIRLKDKAELSVNMDDKDITRLETSFSLLVELDMELPLHEVAHTQPI
jgi:hypothetical protein